jgi:hypothetical protein
LPIHQTLKKSPNKRVLHRANVVQEKARSPTKVRERGKTTLGSPQASKTFPSILTESGQLSKADHFHRSGNPNLGQSGAS